MSNVWVPMRTPRSLLPLPDDGFHWQPGWHWLPTAQNQGLPQAPDAVPNAWG